jgi:hypothetical protein
MAGLWVSQVMHFFFLKYLGPIELFFKNKFSHLGLALQARA